MFYRVVQWGATEYEGTTLGTTKQTFRYILLHQIKIVKMIKALFYKGLGVKERKRVRGCDNSTYPKVAVQWLNQALCFYQSFCLIESEVLRNRHPRLSVKRYGAISEILLLDWRKSGSFKF